MDLVKNIKPSKNKRVKKRIVKTAALLLAIGIALTVTYYYTKKSSRSQGEVIRQTAEVKRGDLKVIISGSGTLASASTLTVTSDVEGAIKKIFFKDGDWVKAGEPIMEIDDGEALLDIRKLQNNIAKTELTRSKLLESVKDSEISAPISGEVTDIKIKDGDNITQNSALITITDKSLIKLVLPFKNSYKDKIEIDQRANIFVFDSVLGEVYRYSGNVTYISSSPDNGSQEQLYNIEFTFKNSGNIDDTMMGSAEITVDGMTLKSHEAAKLSYSDTVTVKSDIAGVVADFQSIKGQYVNKGDVLAKIKNDDDKAIDLETNRLSLEEMNIQLEYLSDKLSKYIVYSSIDGTLALEDIKEGKTIKQGQTVFKVVNYNLMEFQISIDELDIAKIAEGQPVSVTVDALPETTSKPLTGTVSHIASEGTSNSGVAVYPVKVKLNEVDSRLKVGMNVNGEITVNEKRDALYLPIEAVQKRGNTNIVYVLDRDNSEITSNVNRQSFERSRQSQNENSVADFRQDDKQSPGQNIEGRQIPEGRQSIEGRQSTEDRQNTEGRQNIDTVTSEENQQVKRESREEQNTAPVNRVQGGYYDGAVIRNVETGINNDDNIEILSGLKERDIIILPQLSRNSTTTNTQERNFFNGGGMPMRMNTAQPRR